KRDRGAGDEAAGTNHGPAAGISGAADRTTTTTAATRTTAPNLPRRELGRGAGQSLDDIRGLADDVDDLGLLADLLDDLADELAAGVPDDAAAGEPLGTLAVAEQRKEFVAVGRRVDADRIRLAGARADTASGL